MENFDDPLDHNTQALESNSGSLQITPNVREMWRQIANWSMFFAILLFIALGLMTIFGLLVAFSMMRAETVLILFLFIIYGTLIFFPGLYFYRFAQQAKLALRTDDTNLMEEAFLNLKRFYRFTGIVLIVFIGLYLLIIGMVQMMMSNADSMMPD